MESVNGTVTDVSKYSYISSTGEVYNVEITINNPGALKPDMKANVDIDTSNGVVSSTDMGTLALYNNQTLKTDTGGTIKTINVTENQYVKAGDVLLNLIIMIC